MLLVSSESEANKVLILHCGSSIPLRVSSPEGVSQPLDLDTAHYEVVQSQSPPSWVVPGHQVLGECWREPIQNINYILLIKTALLTDVTCIPLPGELEGIRPGLEFLPCFCHSLRTFFSSR